jgi:hypothetical protein
LNNNPPEARHTLARPQGPRQPSISATSHISVHVRIMSNHYHFRPSRHFLDFSN